MRDDKPFAAIKRAFNLLAVATVLLFVLVAAVAIAGYLANRNRIKENGGLIKENAAIARVHVKELSQGNLQLRLAVYTICRSDGRTAKECRKISQGVILPVLTRAQETQIIKVLGKAGANGPFGPHGLRGLLGRAGISGRRGPRGLPGPRGLAGPQGAPGTGVKGDRGPTGARGLTGSSGSPGSQGPAGARGPQGVRGPTGPTGPAGCFGGPGRCK